MKNEFITNVELELIIDKIGKKIDEQIYGIHDINGRCPGWETGSYFYLSFVNTVFKLGGVTVTGCAYAILVDLSCGISPHRFHVTPTQSFIDRNGLFDAILRSAYDLIENFDIQNGTEHGINDDITEIDCERSQVVECAINAVNVVMELIKYEMEK